MTAIPEGDRLKAITLEDDRDFALLQAETAGLTLQELRKLLSESNERIAASERRTEEARAKKVKLIEEMWAGIASAEEKFALLERRMKEGKRLSKESKEHTGADSCGPSKGIALSIAAEGIGA